MTGVQTCALPIYGQKFGDIERITLSVSLSSLWGCGGDLAEHRGGGHLPAGHTEDGVIDEDDGELFGAMGGVDDFGGSDCGEVAVALIGEDDFVGVGSFHTRCDCGRSAVGDLNHINVKIIISENRTADGCDADGPAVDA